MYQSLIHSGKKRTKHKEKHRILAEPEEGQEYGIVRELLGNGRVKVLCQDNIERIGRIRGAMRNFRHKVLIEKGNLIVVSGREGYDHDKVDVIHKYHHEEANILCTTGSLPDGIARAWNESDGGASRGENDDYIEFREEDINAL